MSTELWRHIGRELDFEEINDMEKKFGVKFPDSYRNCVKRYHGCGVNKSLIDTPSGLRSFGALLSYETSNVEYIWLTYEHSMERMLDGIIPFGIDAGGNLFCFDYRKNAENPPIVLWLHELAVIEDDYDEDDLKLFDIKEAQEEAMQYIADDFEDLLNKLY